MTFHRVAQTSLNSYHISTSLKVISNVVHLDTPLCVRCNKGPALPIPRPQLPDAPTHAMPLVTCLEERLNKTLTIALDVLTLGLAMASVWREDRPAADALGALCPPRTAEAVANLQ